MSWKLSHALGCAANSKVTERALPRRTCEPPLVSVPCPSVHGFCGFPLLSSRMCPSLPHHQAG